MTKVNRAPSFPFYTGDWLADPKVRILTWAEQGKYIYLLASMWEHGAESCAIPRKTAEALVGKPFVARVLAGPYPLLQIVTPADDLPPGPFTETEHLWSDRLFEESQKCRSRSEAARRSIGHRWKK